MKLNEESLLVYNGKLYIFTVNIIHLEHGIVDTNNNVLATYSVIETSLGGFVGIIEKLDITLDKTLSRDGIIFNSVSDAIAYVKTFDVTFDSGDNQNLDTYKNTAIRI